MKPPFSILNAALLLVASLAGAETGKDLHFDELTGKPVNLDRWQGRNVLVLFWRPDCSPCLTEVRALPTIARQNADLLIALVSLQDGAQTRGRLPALPTNVQVMIARDDGRRVLAAFGNDQLLALPYSVMLNRRGAVCERHYGIITPQTVVNWRSRC